MGRATAGEVFTRLSGIYMTAVWWRNMSSADILVATILSQNTTDSNSMRAYKSLKKRYGSWDKVAAAPKSEVAGTIRSGGLPNVKAGRIIDSLMAIKQKFGRISLSPLRRAGKKKAESYLLSLHGVGPKTAAVVMNLAFGMETIPVDTHIHRVANRLGLVSAKTPAKTQQLLEKAVPDGLKRGLHHLLIQHGREVCKARNPKCGECVLNDICRSSTYRPG